MGLVKSGLVTLAAVGLFGLVSMAGCSADGGSGDVGDSTDTQPTEGNAQLPPSSGGGSSGDPVDAGKTDSGKKDSGADAGPPPPTPGTPCTKVDEIKKRKCGACGEQSTICFAADDGGTPTWTEYSTCTGEIAGGCIPGTMETEACGNCGTRVKTCSQYCSWSSPACTGQPANSCTPGGVELSGAGCPADQYRQRSCSATCTYDNFSACMAPPTTIEVPPTLASVNYTIANLSASQTEGRLGGSCPNASISTTIITPYVHLSVHNGNAKDAVVTIFSSQAPGGAIVKTVLAAYASEPGTEAQRKACTKGTNSYGDTTITGSSDFASLHGTQAVTVPAGGTITVYLAGELATSTGIVKLSVRTDKFN